MRTLLFLTIMLNVISSIQAQVADKTYNLLIGTYTNKEKTNGIHVYSFNPYTGQFSAKTKIPDIINPSYLTISPDKNHIYAVSEVGEGRVMAYTFDPQTGALTLLNSVPSGGAHPCYVSIDDKKTFVYAGNYSTGSLSAIPVNHDGSLNSDIQILRHHGSSINPSRQEGPHVHAVVIAPDGKYLFVPDLGIDKIQVYAIDPGDPYPLKATTAISVAGGSGPRHLTFHPNGKFAYLIQELDGSVTMFDYNKGKLFQKQSISLLPDGFKGEIGAADIHISPDGEFLYASNRGDANDITIFAIDKTGKLTFTGRQPTLGKTPRNFAIDPSGNFLLVANQNSNEVVIFKRNRETGLLRPANKRIAVDKPVCLKFVEVE